MGFDTYIRFALALVLVVGLIALIAWLVRRFGLAGTWQRNGGREDHDRQQADGVGK